jgi:hypothetical protein
LSVFITTDEDYEAQPPELVTPEDDWDVLTIHPVVSAASLLAAHQLYDKGAAYNTHGIGHSGFADMFVAEREFAELACGTGRFGGRVVYKGIADTDRPVRFHIETHGERSTYDSVISPISDPDAAPHDISQPRLAVTVKYLSSARPDESEIGTNVTPPTPPGGAWVPPDNAFATSVDVILAYPAGWVLEKRSCPNVPGADVWMVEDHYVYYFDWRPNG